MDEKQTQGEKSWKAVYTIIDKEGGGKGVWLRVGTAWVNRDQSLNVKLDASPTNGKLHIRDADPERFASSRTGNGFHGSGARNSNGGDAASDPFGSFPSARRSDGNGGAA